jgi:hypothetical protein
MTADIELGLIGILSSQSFLAGLAIHAGTSAQQIPNGQPLLIVEATNAQRSALGLWKCMCPLRLTTPAAGTNLELHRTRGTQIAVLFDQYGQGPTSPLALDFNSAQSSWNYAGLAGMTVREQVDHERHVIDIEIEIGITPVIL